MTPHTVHLRIARLVVDGSFEDVAALARDPARLAAAMVEQWQGGTAFASASKGAWPGAVANAVATRLESAGVPVVPHGDRHGNA